MGSGKEEIRTTQSDLLLVGLGVLGSFCPQLGLYIWALVFWEFPTRVLTLLRGWFLRLWDKSGLQFSLGTALADG